MVVSSQKLSRFIPEKDFWIKVFKFSLPIGIQNMSAAILGIIDVVKIPTVGYKNQILFWELYCLKGIKQFHR